MTEMTLPSGVQLRILNIPFAEAKDLYQAVLEELKKVPFDQNTPMVALIKEMAWIGFGSKKVEAALWKCFERCLYNGLKIDKETFEAEKAREDYSTVSVEVIQNAILPFSKSLFVESGRLSAIIFGSPK